MSITNQIRLTRFTKYALKLMFTNAELKELGKRFRFNLVALNKPASLGRDKKITGKITVASLDR